jgi:collagenase-like PrtC family protease
MSVPVTVLPPAGQPCADRAPRGEPRPASASGRGSVVGLNAPVRSLKMLELQIAAGATEVYLALRPQDQIPVSFDALPARRDGEATHVSSVAMLRELILTAHDAGLMVHFCADAPVVRPGDRVLYEEHAARGVDAGADTVVVGSVPACDWLASRTGYRLVAGGAMGVSVPAYATYLRDTYRVSRVVLPHSLTLDEVGRGRRVHRAGRPGNRDTRANRWRSGLRTLPAAGHTWNRARVPRRVRR